MVIIIIAKQATPTEVSPFALYMLPRVRERETMVLAPTTAVSTLQGMQWLASLHLYIYMKARKRRGIYKKLLAPRICITLYCLCANAISRIERYSLLDSLFVLFLFFTFVYIIRRCVLYAYIYSIFTLIPVCECILFFFFLSLCICVPSVFLATERDYKRQNFLR